MMFRWMTYVARLGGAVLAAAFLVGMAMAAPFTPVDEGAGDASFAAFRKELIRTLAKRDVQALKPFIHPDAISSFGGRPGRDVLLRELERNPRLWEELSRILAGGGRFVTETDEKGRRVRTFYAPCTYFAEIPGVDAMMIVVLTGRDVPVRAAPSPDGRVIARFTNEALEVVLGDRADNRNWFEVKLPDGRRGFVKAGRDVATSGDYRAGFVKSAGRWKLKYFVGGD